MGVEGQGRVTESSGRPAAAGMQADDKERFLFQAETEVRGMRIDVHPVVVGIVFGVQIAQGLEPLPEKAFE